MFEKEAEEYVDLSGNRNYTERAFKDGAEYGYKKAMEEWKKHFLQCSSFFCSDIFSSVKCYGELGNMAKKESE